MFSLASLSPQRRCVNATWATQFGVAHANKSRLNWRPALAGTADPSSHPYERSKSKSIFVNSVGGTPMRTKPCLTTSDVKKALAACEAEAAKNKWAVAISIVDDGGFPLGFLRMDGAPPISAEVSLGKARTSAMTKRPSKFFEDRVKERPA